MIPSRFKRWVRIGVTTATLFVVAAPRVEAQSGQRGAPTVFIEAYRSTDTVGRAIAASLREALPNSVSPTRLAVISTATIDAFRNSGEPDDWGGAWPWADVRLAGRSYRATCVIDLLAFRSPHGIMVRVAKLCSPFKGDAETLEPVIAPTVDAAVAILAKRLASDSALFAVRPPPPPPALPPVDSAQIGRFRVRVKDFESGRFLAMEYVLFTPPTRTLRSSSLESGNWHTTATADGWGPIQYERRGNYAIELNAVLCGKENWALANPQRKPFVVTGGELTSIEFVVRKSTLRMAKAYYNPKGDPCPS